MNENLKLEEMFVLLSNMQERLDRIYQLSNTNNAQSHKACIESSPAVIVEKSHTNTKFTLVEKSKCFKSQQRLILTPKTPSNRNRQRKPHPITASATNHHHHHQSRVIIDGHSERKPMKSTTTTNHINRFGEKKNDGNISQIQNDNNSLSITKTISTMKAYSSSSNYSLIKSSHKRSNSKTKLFHSNTPLCIEQSSICNTNTKATALKPMDNINNKSSKLINRNDNQNILEINNNNNHLQQHAFSSSSSSSACMNNPDTVNIAKLAQPSSIPTYISPLRIATNPFYFVQY